MLLNKSNSYIKSFFLIVFCLNNVISQAQAGNLVSITFPLSPYIVNNKTATTVTGTAKDNITKVSVTLFRLKDNKLNEILEKQVDVLNNKWSWDLPSNLSDGTYLIRANYQETNIYSEFKINCCVPSLNIKSPINLQQVPNTGLIISGFASIGSKVILQLNNINIAELTTSYSGLWSYKINSTLADGCYVLVAKAFNPNCADKAAYETILFQVGATNC